MRLFFSTLVLLATSFGAQACPNYQLWGEERYELSGSQLYTPSRFNVVAGGQHNLANCGLRAHNWSGPMPGYVITKPDFSITVSGIKGYELEFRVESQCDSTLLINTAGANWYFDDDDNGNADPKIRLTRPGGNGVYDVWIGTFDGNNCNAQLIVETF